MSELIMKVQTNKRGAPDFSTAEPIVRCRECKWLKKWDDGEQTCRRIGVGYIVGADDYCSYGERRCGK